MADTYLTWLQTVISNGHGQSVDTSAQLALAHIHAARAALTDGRPIEGLMLTLLAGQAHLLANHDATVERLERRLIRIEQACPGLQDDR